LEQLSHPTWTKRQWQRKKLSRCLKRSLSRLNKEYRKASLIILRMTAVITIMTLRTREEWKN
jgi:hypothetical protein